MVGLPEQLPTKNWSFLSAPLVMIFGAARDITARLLVKRRDDQTVSVEFGERWNLV